MNDRELIHKLSELKTVKAAPALWRAGARERLLGLAERQADKPYTWAESWNLRLAHFKLVAAPLPLIPALATFVLVLVGSVPFTNAMNGSVPGSSLYPLKRAYEKVELAFRPGPTAQGQLQLDLAEHRLNELAKLPIGSPAAGPLLRDYNISLGFAQAGLRAAPVSSSVAANYDARLAKLSNVLTDLRVEASAKPAYVVALSLTDKLSSEALGLLVAAHQSGNNGLLPGAVSERLERHITKLEVKLDNVETKIQGFPKNEPAPKVVIVSRQTIVPVREARQLAKDSLTQAKELVQKNEFTLALQKVQEGEEITSKTEEAVDEVTDKASEVQVEKVEGASTESGAAADLKPAVDVNLPPAPATKTE